MYIELVNSADAQALEGLLSIGIPVFTYGCP